METQIQLKEIEQVAKDIFVLFGANTKTCKVEFNLATKKVRILKRKDQITKDSIVFNRKVLEDLSKKVDIKDLETRMVETILRGLVKVLAVLNVEIVEERSEVYEAIEVKEVTFVARFVDTNELVKFNHENIDEIIYSNREFKVNVVNNMILREVA